MKTIIVSVAAKNVHKSLAAWCLKAFCDSKGLKNVEVLETNINAGINETVGRIFSARPNIVAFSCYIWNIEFVRKMAPLVKQLLPQSTIILGGPEVSFEENLNTFPFADYIIKGAGEESFFQLISSMEQGVAVKEKLIDGCAMNFNGYPTPYTETYFNSFSSIQLSIENSLVYYESSRGCPFSCSYCLSSTEKNVQYLDLNKVENDLLLLTVRGAKCIKFVDRTFNADSERAKKILEYIGSLDTSCVFHFEAAADLFSDELLAVIEKMPLGRIQFEIGVQSTNEQSLKASTRKTNTGLVLENIRKLVGFQNSHIHVDLIAGLPHETISTFAEAVNECISVRPHVLQLGFLKMLKGTKLRKEYEKISAVFADFPPYEVYRTETLGFSEILELKKIESILDKFYNSGAFNHSVDFALRKLFSSPYAFLKQLSDFCTDNLKISMKSLYTLLFNFLCKFGDKTEVEHYIKMDCFSVDSQGLLPDEILPKRNKEAENLYRSATNNKSANIRIEFFPLTGKFKLFNYDCKDPLTNRFISSDFDF